MVGSVFRLVGMHFLTCTNGFVWTWGRTREISLYLHVFEMNQNPPFLDIRQNPPNKLAKKMIRTCVASHSTLYCERAVFTCERAAVIWSGFWCDVDAKMDMLYIATLLHRGVDLEEMTHQNINTTGVNLSVRSMTLGNQPAWPQGHKAGLWSVTDYVLASLCHILTRYLCVYTLSWRMGHLSTIRGGIIQRKKQDTQRVERVTGGTVYNPQHSERCDVVTPMLTHVWAPSPFGVFRATQSIAGLIWWGWRGGAIKNE